MAAYLVVCAITRHFAGGRSTRAIARQFVLTLVPIAVGYLVAHNLTSLFEQGRNVIPLLSDPFGRRWDLFGTAGYRPDIGLFDARLTWTVAIVAIVAGHVVAVWLAHRLALAKLGSPRRAALASLVMTVLMVGYTAVSLAIIAEPMVKFESVEGNR